MPSYNNLENIARQLDNIEKRARVNIQSFTELNTVLTRLASMKSEFDALYRSMSGGGQARNAMGRFLGLDQAQAQLVAIKTEIRSIQAGMQLRGPSGAFLPTPPFSPAPLGPPRGGLLSGQGFLPPVTPAPVMMGLGYLGGRTSQPTSFPPITEQWVRDLEARARARAGGGEQGPSVVLPTLGIRAEPITQQQTPEDKIIQARKNKFAEACGTGAHATAKAE